MIIKKYYVYSIFNILNGKIYIGKTNNPKKRFLRHIRDAAGENPKYFFALHRAIKKYGKENFVFSILQTFDDLEFVNLAEQYWIKYFNTKNKEFGYNLTDGGDGASGAKRTAETKRKMSNSMRGKKRSQAARQRISLGRIGMILTTQHKQNMSKSRKNKYNGEDNNFYGMKHSNESKEKFSKLKIKDVISIREEFSLMNVTKSSLAKKYGVSYDTILNIIKGKTWKDVR